VSDGRLRELERAGRAGDVEAYGQYLQEKVRQGSLTEEKVELLAHLLWPPAWKALGWQRHGRSGAPFESFRAMLFKRPGQEQLYEIAVRLKSWAHGISRRWGKEIPLRVAAAAAHYRMTSWRRQFLALHSKGWVMPCPLERVETLLHMIDLRAAKPWVVNPAVWNGAGYEPDYTDATASNVAYEGRLFLAQRSPIADDFRMMTAEDPRIPPLFAGRLAIFVGNTDPDALGSGLEDCVESRWPEKDETWGQFVQAREFAIYEAIRSELVPFILGDGDPVSDRVKAWDARAEDAKLAEKALAEEAQ
jgi:hypothetical protein